MKCRLELPYICFTEVILLKLPVNSIHLVRRVVAVFVPANDYDFAEENFHLHIWYKK